jgi:iron uptake system component EfeO
LRTCYSHRLPGAALVACGLLALTGCSTDPEPAAATSDAAGPVQVDAADDSCSLSRTDLTSGITTFAISNSGSQVTEVYVYDGDRIVTEKENIGPGTSYDLTVDLPAGSYQVACKPGMTGDGIRTDIAVAGGTTTEDPVAAEAAADYRAWVGAQTDELVPLVQQFAAAVKAGNVEGAKALYALSREPWERIEPVAESFGDLDPRIDIREADLEPGQDFTGWHRLEKALWTGENLSGLGPVADQLVADVAELQQRVPNAVITATSIGNGAKELLDEVATGKVTGEEEAFSHSDLVDFAANVEGAAKGFDVLRPLVEQNDPDLVATLDEQFAAVDAALAAYRQGEGFVSYDTVDEAGRRELARVVDALGEPLSRLAAVATG